MEREKPPPYVQYVPGDGTVTLVEAESESSPSSVNATCQSRCRQKILLKIAVLLSVVAVLIVLTSFTVLREKLYPSAEPINTGDLPDVDNLQLLSITDNSITFTWERPQARFDYYWVSISGESEEKNEKQYIGSCSNGTIIHASQSRVTCTNIDACTNVSFTVRTHSNGPPERTSKGVAIGSIFIAEKDPEAPKNITAIGISPLLTRLQWAPSPASINRSDIAYAVKVCTDFTSCDTDEGLNGCTEKETFDTWLEFESTMGTMYCIVLEAIEHCGPHVLRSSKAMSVTTATLFDLPDVENLELLSAMDNSITVAWKRPETSFDYYWISLRHDNEEMNASSKEHRIGSCSNGTIIHASQSRVTCTNVDACTNVSLTVRTHITGPPERTSLGATVDGIVIAGQDPHPPRNVTARCGPHVLRSPAAVSMIRTPLFAPPDASGLRFVDAGDDFFSVKWTRPVASFDYYRVVVTPLLAPSHSVEDFKNSTPRSSRSLPEPNRPPARTSNGVKLYIRTTEKELPEVANLKVENITATSFTVTWERPKECIEYYTVDVTDHGSGMIGDKFHSVVSCNNGAAINPRQTKLTCTKSDTCTSISVRVRTHVRGPPERVSTGVKLENVLLPGAGLPEVTNLKLAAVKNDSLTVAFQAPKECVDDIPEMVNVTLVSSIGTTITVSWLRPTFQFDRYMVDVTENDVDSDGSLVGRCAFGNNVAHSNLFMCGNLQGCRNVSLHIRTYSEGPPERTVLVTGIQGIFVPGLDPDPPSDITMVETSPPKIRLQWKRPEKLYGRIEGYTVKILPPDVTNLRLLSVGAGYFTAVWERPKVTFDYYWIEVTGDNIYDNVPPEVTNLKLSAVEADTFVLTWERPKACFDYYTVEFTDETNGGRSNVQCNNGAPEVSNLKVENISATSFVVTWQPPKESIEYYTVEVTDHGSGHIGDGFQSIVSCSNGSVIDPRQTSLTCTKSDTCTSISVQVKTHTRGPPERESCGVALENVLLPGTAAVGITNLTLLAADNRYVTLTWDQPKGNFDFYLLDVTVRKWLMELILCESLIPDYVPNGTIIRAEETQVTCGPFDSCTGITVTVRTFSKGPPEHTSVGATLKDVFIGGRALPDVTNLTLVASDNHYMTLAWDQPQANFDYYWLEVTGGNAHENASLKNRRPSTCGDGTIIRPDQNQVTCGPFDACSSVSVTIRTYSKGATGTHLGGNHPE
ncbi:hypothetical protein MTO96_007674 [Rhipicephalus appendiculatus]